MDRTREQIAADIIKFAQDSNLQIHPGQDPLKWADLVIKKDGCPCVPGRPYCPCLLALEDIKQLDRCRCGLFCNGDYLKVYNELNTKKKRSSSKYQKSAKAD